MIKPVKLSQFSSQLLHVLLTESCCLPSYKELQMSPEAQWAGWPSSFFTSHSLKHWSTFLGGELFISPTSCSTGSPFDTLLNPQVNQTHTHRRTHAHTHTHTHAHTHTHTRTHTHTHTHTHTQVFWKLKNNLEVRTEAVNECKSNCSNNHSRKSVCVACAT